MRFTVTQPNVVIFDFLIEQLKDYTKTRIRHLLKNRLVLVNGRIISRNDFLLRKGDELEIVMGNNKPISTLRCPYRILFEDEHIIAVEKPVGLLTVSTDNEKEKTLFRKMSDFVKTKEGIQAKIFVVHRLDREVSGVILFAKTQEIQKEMQSYWDGVVKTYYAVCEGVPTNKQGKIETWLHQNKALNVYSGMKSPDAYFAITNYKVAEDLGKYSLIEVDIETGRKHQIRVHLSDLGCPIVGDERYKAQTNPLRRLGLHAYSLSFTHPVTRKKHVLRSSLPTIFEEFIAYCKELQTPTAK